MKRIPVAALIEANKLFIGDGYRAKNSELSDEGLPFARAGNLNNGFQFDEADCIPSDKVKKVGNKRSVVGDVAFTSKGTIGRFGFVTQNTKEFVYSPQLCFWRSLDFDIINPQYLYYWMNSSLFLSQVVMVSGQTDMAPYVNLRDQRKMYIDLPPLPNQQKIASILSAYDELIENNNQRIQLLEEMAEEIYKEWFVRLRFPGHENTPIKDGVPEGWGKIKLKAFCKKVTDGTHDTPKPLLDGYYLVTGKNIKSGSIDFSTAYKISEKDHVDISKRSGLKKGDILMSNIGTIGSLAMIDQDFEFSVKNVLIFKPKDQFQSAFLYFLLNQKSTLSQLLLSSSGSSQQFIGLNYARDFKILNPGNKLIEAFGKFVIPVLQQKSILRKKNSVLRETRDLLLPRLISGKLSVEHLLEEEKHTAMVAEPGG